MKHSLLALAAMATIVTLGTVPAAVQAGALTDGSMGAVQSLSGRFVVPQSLGTVRGANLFHSFARFGISPGEAATFATADPGLRFVISRVTGGEPSLLQGPLQLQAVMGSRPDFVFINPAGITVMAGGQFDVPAGLHLSTAHLIRFADGATWDAHGATGSSLTTAAPESFGFLGTSAAAPIEIQGWMHNAVGNASLSVSAGTITIDSSQLDFQEGGLFMHATGAAAVQMPLSIGGRPLLSHGVQPIGDGQLTLRDTRLAVSGAGPIFLAGGRLDILDSDLLAANQTADRGLVQLRALGNLFVTDSTVTSTTYGTAGAADIDIHAGNELTIGAGDAQGSGSTVVSEAVHGSDSVPDGPLGSAGAIRLRAGGAMTLFGWTTVYSDAKGNSAGGPITIKAGELTIDPRNEPFGGILNWTTEGRAPGGEVDVQVRGALRLLRGGTIASDSFGDGPSGTVTVHAGSLDIDGQSGASSGISSDAVGASGPAGGVRVLVDGPLTIRGHGYISSQTYGGGDAGPVTIDAQSMQIAGPQTLLYSEGVPLVGGILSEALPGSTGRSGDITVRIAGALNLTHLGTISSSTLSSGAAGSVKVQAGTLTVDGSGMGAGVSGIGSLASAGSGPAGAVDVDVTGPVSLRRGGGISTDTYTDGAGGSVTVRAGSLRIDGFDANGGETGIASRAVGGTGAAGGVDVRVAGDVVIVGGGGISSSTRTPGRGGSVYFGASSLEIDGSGSQLGPTGIIASADAASSGAVGTVTVQVVGPVVLRHGATLSVANDALASNTATSGESGLVLSADRLDMLRATITAAASANADAAPIDVRVRGDIRLQQSEIRTSAVQGRGGMIHIGADGIVALRDSGITTSVGSATGGDGGDIRLSASALVLASGVVQANTVAAAQGGTVSIDTHALLPDGSHIFIGGDRIVAPARGVPGMNVVQAAAPDGVSGQLNLTLPQVSLAGTLLALATDRIDFGLLVRDMCAEDGDSSFGMFGQGALPRTAAQPLRWPLR